MIFWLRCLDCPSNRLHAQVLHRLAFRVKTLYCGQIHNFRFYRKASGCDHEFNTIVAFFFALLLTVIARYRRARRNDRYIFWLFFSEQALDCYHKTRHPRATKMVQ